MIYPKRRLVVTLHNRPYLRVQVACVLLFYCVVGYPAYGVEIQLPGINIDQLLSIHTAKKYIPPAGGTHLDTMLEGYPFPPGIIEEQVSVVLSEQSAMSLSDTDESAELDGIYRDISNKQYARFTARSNMDPSRILLKPEEVGLSSNLSNELSPGDMARALLVKLSRDAFRIANAHHNGRTREATTCLCVVLRDEEQRPKKLVFHNSTGKMLPSMWNKADDLAYGIRNAYLAHAEAQFIDFLLYRARQREDEIKNTGQAKHPCYTHILGMGCSRKHCPECDVLFKLFLGTRYHIRTAAMGVLPGEQNPPTLEAYTQENGEDCMRVTTPAQIFQVMHQEGAVREGGNRSVNYRLSDRLQASIREKSALTHLNFSAPRFHIRSHVSSTEEQATIQEQEKDLAINDEYEPDTELATTSSERKKRRTTSSP